MDDLTHQGKVLYWGTSEWSDEQIQRAVDFCEAHNLYKPQVEQPQYNLFERKRFEQEIMPAAHKNGMGLVTWSPLASGLLTGKYDDGLPKGARPLESVPIDAVERIEITRGSAAALTGGGSESAVVQIFTRSTGETRARISMAAGRDAARRLAGAFAASLGRVELQASAALDRSTAFARTPRRTRSDTRRPRGTISARVVA